MARQRAEDKDRIAELENQLRHWRELAWCLVREQPDHTAKISVYTLSKLRPDVVICTEPSFDGHIYRAMTKAEFDSSDLAA